MDNTDDFAMDKNHQDHVETGSCINWLSYSELNCDVMDWHRQTFDESSSSQKIEIKVFTNYNYKNKSLQW